MTSAIGLNRALEAVRHLSDPTPPWDEILQCSRQVVGGDSASFILLDGNSELLTVQQCNVSTAALAEYTDHFYASDIVVPRALGTVEGTWLDTNELFSRASLERNSYYVDFMCRHRMRQMLTFIVEESPSRRGGLTIQREVPLDRARQRLESESVRTFTRALQTAVRNRRTEAQQLIDAADSTFRSLGEATCLVSPMGGVIRQSAFAQQLMWERASLRHRNGRLWHPRPEVRERLSAALRSVSALDGHLSISVAAEHGGACVLDIVRADRRLSIGNEPLVFVRLRFNDAVNHVSSGVLRASYGLTAAEERLLTALVAGQSPIEFARLQAISINTVRKQISILMEKMDCHRQVDLVRKAYGESQGCASSRFPCSTGASRA